MGHKVRWLGEYKRVHIFKDYGVMDEEKIYLGNGQGCHTFWFKTVEDAKRFIDKYHESINPHMFGLGLIPHNLCENCKNHYTYGTEEWKNAKENNCFNFKEELKKKALQP